MPAKRKEFFDELEELLQKAATLQLKQKEITDYVKENYNG